MTDYSTIHKDNNNIISISLARINNLCKKVNLSFFLKQQDSWIPVQWLQRINGISQSSFTLYLFIQHLAK